MATTFLTLDEVVEIHRDQIDRGWPRLSSNGLAEPQEVSSGLPPNRSRIDR